MTDVLHIDDPKAAELARELAKRTGESVGDAVMHALEREIERNPLQREKPSREARKAAVLEIVKRFNSHPVLDGRSPDEILGYDENGLPG
jgi:antitoxin VapB